MIQATLNAEFRSDFLPSTYNDWQTTLSDSPPAPPGVVQPFSKV